MLEVVRIIADWLADPTDGVNALLPGVPLDGTDTVPDDVAEIRDETRDDETATKQLAEVSPLLVVHSMGSAVEAGPTQGVVRYGTTDLLVRYQVIGPAPAALERSSYYTLRAVERSLLRLMKPEHYARRERNAVGIIYVSTSFQVVRIDTQLQDQQSTSGLTFSVRWRDTSPEG